MENLIKKVLYIWIIFNSIDRALCGYNATMDAIIRSQTVLDPTYDAVSRPYAPMDVFVAINLVTLGELDLKKQTMSAVGWLTVSWKDERLCFDKALKGDIDSVFAKPDQIWKPELVIDNSLDKFDVFSDSKFLLRYYFDGSVTWKPYISFQTHCTVDVTFYPYDQQSCSISVVSWGTTNTEITLKSFNLPQYHFGPFEEHGEWTVTKTEIQNNSWLGRPSNDDDLEFPQLKFWIFIERKAYYYSLNVIMPTLLTSLLVTLVFVVPVESGEKISYVLTILLSIAVLSSLVANSLSTSISTSLLGLYLGLVFVLAAVGVALTVGVVIIYHREGPPNSSSKILVITRFAARVTCHSSVKQRPRTGQVSPSEIEVADKSETDIRPDSSVSQRPRTSKVAPSEIEVADKSETDFRSSSQPICPPLTWMDVSTILDRFCFFVFSFVTVFMNLFFIIAMVVGGSKVAPPPMAPPAV